MATTATLVDSTPHRLRYLLTEDGLQEPPGINTLTISNATLLADSSPGPLRDMINAQTNGYPPRTTGTPRIAAGAAMTQAQARMILASDDTASAVLTNDLIGRAILELAARTGPGHGVTADVNVDGNNDPTIVVYSNRDGAATTYLNIIARSSKNL